MSNQRPDSGRPRRRTTRRPPADVAPGALPPAPDLSPPAAAAPPPSGEAAPRVPAPGAPGMRRERDFRPRRERGFDSRPQGGAPGQRPRAERPPGDFRSRERGPRDRGGNPGNARDGGFRRREGGARNGAFRPDERRPREGGIRPRDGARPGNGDARGFTPRAEGDDSQANAINRSRPLYENNGRDRGNRGFDRRGRGGRPDFGRGPGRNDVRRGRPQGAFDPKVSRGLPQRQRVEEPAGLPALPSNPREAALRILQAVDTRSAFSDRLLDGAHLRGGPDARDQALLHELVKGTLRLRGRIDWTLDRLIHIGLDKVQPWIKNVLRLGAYQVMFLDRVPAHAAVDEAVKLAHQYGHPGTAGLANSVLRRLVDEKDTLLPPEGDDVESLSVWGSHPVWIVRRWLERFGPEATRALMTANNRPVPIGLRANRLKMTRDELIGRLAAEGVTATPARYSPDVAWASNAAAPGALEAFKRGFCTAQDESEALVGRLVGPEPHERLLDLCAAPGGKCTHLAELMEDEGEVWAMERAEGRVDALETAIQRLGLHSIHVQQGDGRTYDFPMPFDRVLVDAPCSGLGVLGRRADARWRKGPEVLREMPPLQAELLAAGGRRLRPGGVLVYSVCSFEPEETTEMVERFLHANPAFVLEDASARMPEGVVDAQGCMTVFPHLHGCDGAFAARFRRT